ncbi:hypothetical protein BU24DRAFT_423436 [Aaosphaeria arxii CBS 175.79]|uniref:Uncharacterized protein n=1 Tax=Aaosphaeria arxii CBS 175.79 TaxID=1450172 RepID=A0A6A5XNJ1_9PLEO|nr:uncharacterized protein BU24DRAFT_423436 [Aaosphaeria arxii CBS 175.79]KAF2014503.1 hypothetical protein BU24DRAFT_423436 [Aaosphaeria arxii CBS 175.79]
MAKRISLQGANLLRRNLCQPNRLRPFTLRTFSTKAEPPHYSYDTIKKRLEAQPNLVRQFEEALIQLDIAKGRWVDIHYGDDAESVLSDVSISDLQDKDMRTDLSELFGIPYLATASKQEADEAQKTLQGMLFGPKRRPVVASTVRFEGQCKWVFFMVNTGAYYTYLSSQAYQALGLHENDQVLVTLAGHYHNVRMSPRNSHFQDLNFLGWDFLLRNDVSIRSDRKNKTIQLLFEG